MTKEELDKEIARLRGKYWKDKEIEELRKNVRELREEYEKGRQEFDDWLDQLGVRAVYYECMEKLHYALYVYEAAYKKLKRAEREQEGAGVD